MENGSTVQVTAAKLALKTAQGVGTSEVRLVVDGEAVEGFAGDDALGGLPAKAIKGQFARAVKGSHTVAVGAAGGLGPEGPQVGNGAALDQGKVADVLLYVEYKAVMP